MADLVTPVRGCLEASQFGYKAGLAPRFVAISRYLSSCAYF